MRPFLFPKDTVMPLTTDIDNADVFLIVDVHNLVRGAEETRGPVAGFRTKAHKYPTGAVYLSIRGLFACIKHYGFTKGLNVCVVLSDQENSQRRRARYPNYKAGRVRKEYSVFELVDHIGKEAERQHNPVQDFMEMAQCLPSIRPVMKTPWETDDAMAAFKHQIQKRNPNALFVIRSKDRDMWSEIDDNVIVTGGPKNEFTVANLEHAYRITKPRLLPLAKALFGDSSDKLKKAVPRVTEDNIPAGILDKVRIRRGVPLSECFAEMLRKNKKLIKGTSLELCIGKEAEIQFMIDLIRLRRNLKLILVTSKGDKKKMLSLASWYEFKAMAKDIEAMFVGNNAKCVQAKAGSVAKTKTPATATPTKPKQKRGVAQAVDPSIASRFVQRRGAGVG